MSSDMSIEDALGFFEHVPKIKLKLSTLVNVGSRLHTSRTTFNDLSGGEAQRVKLATELSKKDTGNTMYILDEPTTGLLLRGCTGFDGGHSAACRTRQYRAHY